SRKPQPRKGRASIGAAGRRFGLRPLMRGRSAAAAITSFGLRPPAKRTSASTTPEQRAREACRRGARQLTIIESTEQSSLRRSSSRDNSMPRLLVTGFSISLDGYGAGPGQSTSDPLGAGGERLHEWLVNTDAFKRTHSSGGGAGVGGGSGADEDFAARGMTGIGAWILGRNMFGPV